MKIENTTSSISLRAPDAADGFWVHQLVASCKPLDENSVYCNLLQCSHFSSTCCLAEIDGRIMGFVSAYRLPENPDTLFIWQVAVSKEARGNGLAGRMIESLLSRQSCEGVHFIEATITADNKASWGLFEGLAKKLSTELSRGDLFDCDQHFNGQHQSELRMRLGPIAV